MAHWPDREPATLENAIPIDRRSNLSPMETMGRYLVGEGTPVVVTDAQENWRARKLWSLDYFKKHYADEPLIASDRAPLRHEDNPKMQTLRTTLGEYIDYMQKPNHGPIAQRERDAPFYGNSWSPFIDHETLRGHLTRPYFTPDDIPCSMGCPVDMPCNRADEGHERLDRSFTKIFLGPAGTVTRLHNDTYHTHAWLSQIRGAKQFILYPPSQRSVLHCNEGVGEGKHDHGASQTWFDPLAPDYDRFPRARDATPYVAVCGPGDTILVPSLWYHYAVALTPSITCMRNFMNQHNVDGFMTEWNRNQSGEPKEPAGLMSRLPFPPPALPPPKPGFKNPSVRSSVHSDDQITSSGAHSDGHRSGAEERKDGFVPSDRFAGARPGSVFKMGPSGLGYYLDAANSRPPSQQAPMLNGGIQGSLVGVTVDAGRSVQRHYATTGTGAGHAGVSLRHRPAVVVAVGETAEDGLACESVAPHDEPCGRRSGTAWRWGLPKHRRAMAHSQL